MHIRLSPGPFHLRILITNALWAASGALKTPHFMHIRLSLGPFHLRILSTSSPWASPNGTNRRIFCVCGPSCTSAAPSDDSSGPRRSFLVFGRTLNCLACPAWGQTVPVLVLGRTLHCFTCPAWGHTGSYIQLCCGWRVGIGEHNRVVTLS